MSDLEPKEYVKSSKAERPKSNPNPNTEPRDSKANTISQQKQKQKQKQRQQGLTAEILSMHEKKNKPFSPVAVVEGYLKSLSSATYSPPKDHNIYLQDNGLGNDERRIRRRDEHTQTLKSHNKRPRDSDYEQDKDETKEYLRSSRQDLRNSSKKSNMVSKMNSKTGSTPHAAAGGGLRGRSKSRSGKVSLVASPAASKRNSSRRNRSTRGDPSPSKVRKGKLVLFLFKKGEPEDGLQIFIPI
jgi:hypothetical protein